MQTFLPYEDFVLSAYSLDRARLGKQRVETKQIFNALTDPTKGWKNHPATKMWRGFESALCDYGVAICVEWRSRGYKDSLLPFFQEMRSRYGETIKPCWLGDPALHQSHQSNLLRKDPEHYGQWHWPVTDDLPYVWPV